MICHDPTCSTVLGGKLHVFLGKYYCDDHIKAASAPKVAAAAPVTGVCSRCAAEIQGGLENEFVVRTVGKPDVGGVFCPDCTAQWAAGSAMIAYEAMVEFLEIGAGVEEEGEPEPIPDPIPDPVASLAPRPGERTVAVSIEVPGKPGHFAPPPPEGEPFVLDPEEDLPEDVSTHEDVTQSGLLRAVAEDEATREEDA